MNHRLRAPSLALCAAILLIASQNPVTAQTIVIEQISGSPPANTLLVKLPKSRAFPKGRTLYVDTIYGEIEILSPDGLSKKHLNGMLDTDEQFNGLRAEFRFEADFQFEDYSFETGVLSCAPAADNSLINPDWIWCGGDGGLSADGYGFALEPLFVDGRAKKFKLHFGPVTKDGKKNLPFQFEIAPPTVTYTNDWQERSALLDSLSDEIVTVKVSAGDL